MKKILSLVMILVVVMGTMYIPASASDSENAKKTIYKNGIAAPVDLKWSKSAENTYLIGYQDSKEFYDYLDKGKVYLTPNYFLVAMDEKKTTTKKVIKTLSSKCNKEEMKEVFEKYLVPCFTTHELSVDVDDIEFEDDPVSGRMAVIDFSSDKQSFYLVVRNIADKNIAAYMAYNDYPNSLPEKVKNIVHEYALEMVEISDDTEVCFSEFGIKLPLVSSWALRDNGTSNNISFQYHYGKEDETSILIIASSVEENKVAAEILSLIGSKSNSKKLKYYLMDYTGADNLDLEDLDVKHVFKMKSNGKKGYYAIINTGTEYDTFSIIDGKYLLWCHASVNRYSDDPVPKKVIKQLTNVVKKAY